MVLGRMHQIEPYILFGNVIDRTVAGLFDAKRSAAVGDRLASEHDFDATALREEVDTVIGAADNTEDRVRHVDFLQRLHCWRRLLGAGVPSPPKHATDPAY